MTTEEIQDRISTLLSRRDELLMELSVVEDELGEVDDEVFELEGRLETA